MYLQVEVWHSKILKTNYCPNPSYRYTETKLRLFWLQEY